MKEGSRRPTTDAISFALEEATTSSQPLTHDDTGTLTGREHEIALLVAQGQTNKQIAAHLVISPRTAEGHVQSILAKLGFTSRTQIAAAFARQAASPNDTDVRDFLTHRTAVVPPRVILHARARIICSVRHLR